MERASPEDDRPRLSAFSASLRDNETQNWHKYRTNVYYLCRSPEYTEIGCATAAPLLENRLHTAVCLLACLRLISDH